MKANLVPCPRQKSKEAHIGGKLATGRVLIALDLFHCGKYLIDNMSGIIYTFFMSPTIFRIGNYRFYFFSREENRIHIHVISPDGEAKAF